MKFNFRALLSLLIFFVVFTSCEEEKASPSKTVAEEEVRLQLNERFDKSAFQTPSEVLFPLDAVPQFKNIPSEFTEYVVRNYIFLKEQHLYQQYKQGYFDEEEYNLIKKAYQIKNKNTTDEPVTNEVFVLIGSLKNGKRGVVIDTHLDYDFSNEEIIEFEYPMVYIDEEDQSYFEENKLSLLPRISLTLPSIDAAKVTTSEYHIVVNPYRPFDRFFVSKDDLENKYYLEFLFPSFFETSVSIDNQAYLFQIGPSTNLAKVSTENAELLILARDETQENEFSELLRLQLTDTFNLQQKDYVLDVSKFENQKEIKLTYIKANDRPEGGLIGYYTQLPEGTRYLKSPIKASPPTKNYKYKLYYTWTNWSLASLQEVPYLKEMQKEFPYLEIVGVCVDESFAVSERMQFRRDMQWESAFINATTPNNWASKMRINTYPTYLLVDLNGQIKERSHHLKEITKYLLMNQNQVEIE